MYVRCLLSAFLLGEEARLSFSGDDEVAVGSAVRAHLYTGHFLPLLEGKLKPNYYT